jgi:hypothetical protein
MGGDYVGGKLAGKSFDELNSLSDEEEQKIYTDAYQRNLVDSAARITVEKRD